MGLTYKIGIICLVFLAIYPVNTDLQAQKMPGDYIQKTGNYSKLYSGKIETPYNLRAYQGTPYYNNPNFTPGSIVFDSIEYTGLNIRLDLYKQQAIVLNPANYALIIPSKKIQKINIYDKTFLRIIPAKDSGLKNEGFYISHFRGKNLDLLSEEQVFTSEKKGISNVFETSTKYYLGIGGKYYPVKNKHDFFRLFPNYKGQINNYAKDHHLDFAFAKTESLTALAAFCDNYK